MKKSSLGFTLVEMIVGITLSLILMVSVSVFVSGGLQQIFSQRNMLETQGSELAFLSNLTERIQGINSDISYSYGSGIMLHTSQKLGNSAWVLLGEKQESNFFCDSGSLHPNTNHIILAQIFPFEGQGADISAGKSLDAGAVKIFPYEGRALYGAQTLTGSFLAPTFAVLTGTTLYLSDTAGHSIYRFDTTNLTQSGTKIIGETSYGDTLDSGGNPLNSYLNSPTGLARGEGNLFIADTNNNRILKLNSVGRLEEFLNSSDGIDEPTGLYYDDTRKSLFIVNSGAGEVLEDSSFSGNTIPNLNITFSPKTMTGVTQIRVEFFTTASGITATPSFTGITTTEDYQTGSIDTFDYYISDFSQTESLLSSISIPGCTPNTKKYLEANIPKKEITTCSSAFTGSIQKLYGNNALTFTGGTNYGITLQNVTGDFSESKNYAVKLSLWASGVEKQENYYPYFTHGDNLVSTQNNNILRKVKTGLSYPTGIYKSGGSYFIYDFIQRKRIELDVNGNIISNTSTPAFDFSNKPQHFTDQILSTPISSLQSSFSGGLLNLELRYFKTFSCFDESAPIEKTYLWKKYVMD